MMRLTGLALLLLLAGCVNEPSLPPLPSPVAPKVDAPPAVKVKQVCLKPPKQEWTGDDLKALATALSPIPEISPIMRMAEDWNRMRKDNAACIGAQKN